LIHVKNYQFVSLLISFDVEKVPSRSGTKNLLELILQKQLSLPYFERSKHFGVEEWLNSTIKTQPLKWNELGRVILRPELPLTRNLRRLSKPLIPGKIWNQGAKRFGPNRKRFK
jgi:hypothetical protein